MNDREIAAGGVSDLADNVIDDAEVRELLGRPKVHPERAQQAHEVGIATGMYYTPQGGDIMFVEAAIRRDGVRRDDEDGTRRSCASAGVATTAETSSRAKERIKFMRKSWNLAPHI